MANVAEFEAVARRFGRLADFVFVYVAEAHPEEEGYHDIFAYRMADPKVIEKRMENARVLQDRTELQVYVDDMDDAGSKMFGALPERLYVIRDGRVALKGGPGPFEYSIPELEKWLEENLN